MSLRLHESWPLKSFFFAAPLIKKDIDEVFLLSLSIHICLLKFLPLFFQDSVLIPFYNMYTITYIKIDVYIIPTDLLITIPLLNCF
jgi:hypothetical protein